MNNQLNLRHYFLTYLNAQLDNGNISNILRLI